MSHYTFAARTATMNPSLIRELLKRVEQPGIISFAGGLPPSDQFPVQAFNAAYEKVMREHPRAALQYAASEGFGPLREWVAQSLPWKPASAQVLITNGSQQALDLLGRIFIDEGSRIAVQSPSYLGALQAFSACQPEVWGVPVDAQGQMHLEAIESGQLHHGARFLYVQPNFHNPTGVTMPQDARVRLADACFALGLPIIEDNPYGELWFDAPPPEPLSSVHPENSFYVGSLSKVLAPGLRLGFVVAPEQAFSKLLHVKQATDLHSPGLNQRLAVEVLRMAQFEQEHLPRLRQVCQRRCECMLAALQEHMPQGVSWNTPQGGMFIWMRLPEGADAARMLGEAVAAGVAYVPGAAFYEGAADARTLRLSFVGADEADIDQGVQRLAQVLRRQS